MAADSTSRLGAGAIAARPPNDVRICNGRLYEASTDGGGQSTLAIYPKQPFDIAGRTGTVVFDVSSDSEGPHAAWPEFWWTDQPVPAPHGHLSSNTTYAMNSYGFSLASDTCGANGTNVYQMFITRNGRLEDVPFTKTACVAKGKATGGLNHFEVRMSQTKVEVWAIGAGSTAIKQIAVANLNMPMTRGVIWIEDVHYNANKFNTQGTHTFAWDNVGFDGPDPVPRPDLRRAGRQPDQPRLHGWCRAGCPHGARGVLATDTDEGIRRVQLVRVHQERPERANQRWRLARHCLAVRQRGIHRTHHRCRCPDVGSEDR